MQAKITKIIHIQTNLDKTARHKHDTNKIVNVNVVSKLGKR